MASPQAVREWCRITCAAYPEVEINNMSTSFRNGLAFCAIIHKHRPDLIDFSSLSKDHVYQNNKLAFDVAERKLGIPALLDPKDMVSTKVPDYLSVITYVCQYYYFFNRKSYAGLASLSSSSVTILNIVKSKTPDGLKPLKSQIDLVTSGEDCLSNTRSCSVCNLCFKPVHLIQRHLTDGKIFHRSCFRCKVCQNTLLPGSYTQGSDGGSLICTHHVTDGTRVDSNHQIRSTEFQTGYFSLGGLSISSIPHYTKTPESQDRLVSQISQQEGKESQERSRVLKDTDSSAGLDCMATKPPHPALPRVEDTTLTAAGKTRTACILAENKNEQEATATSELSSPCVRVIDGSSRPAPAARTMLESSVVPVPATRTKAAPPTNSSFTTASSSNQDKHSPNSSHITSPTRGRSKVQTNHPWLAIVHPGPWTQLPPAPPPVPSRQSKSVCNLQTPWNRRTACPPNPFGEEEDGGKPESESADQTKPTADICSTDSASLTGVSVETAVCSSDASQLLSDETGSVEDLPPSITEAAGPHGSPDEAQNDILSRSLSVPARTPTCSQSSVGHFDLMEANGSVQAILYKNKPPCKENRFDQKPQIPKSKSFQAVPSLRAPAPGHGFPLIKRKVQTEQNVSTEDLQVEMREVEKCLEILEQRGVELEGNLRGNKNDDEDEEQMLMEWFSLVHEKQVLMRRETELGHLAKQQKLEEKQADVEYELRCLLNKPVSDWCEEDGDAEQQLMDELVAIIEQRNQIVNSLDQDRQREMEEDKLLEAMMKSKDFTKEGQKELKKPKRKFKPMKMLKMLNHKAENNKDSTDKKS